MADKNYRVNYQLDVNAGNSVKNLKEFADSISKINGAKTNFKDAETNIQNFIKTMDKFFRTTKGKPKKYAYTFDIDTKNLLLKSNNAIGRFDTLIAKADLVKNSLAGIGALSNGKLLRGIAVGADKDLAHINKLIGKTNSALISILDKPRELKIETQTTQGRLDKLLVTLNEIKATTANINGARIGTALSSVQPGATGLFYGPPFAPGISVVPTNIPKGRDLSEKAILRKEQERFDKEHKSWYKNKLKSWEKYNKQSDKEWEEYNKKKAAYETALIKRQFRSEQESARAKVKIERERQQEQRKIESANKEQRRSALQRLTYGTFGGSMRGIPMLGMMNGYMAYSIGKRELDDVLAYSDLMTHAYNILHTSDSDVGTFGSRFEAMKNNVRQVGIDTKYTSFEVADATKFLAMAGLNVDDINNAIRPITNLALIGDDNLGQIADYVTNIMTGYNIKSNSMNAVSDIMASTIARSNVTTTEMAESYKMAAGYLNLSGVSFAESAAAIGTLGNMGLKGTLAGTALRAMSTRFAKPTKEAQKTLDRLGVSFTEFSVIGGKTVERVRPLADIFRDLGASGATLGDMGAIFGKTGGNAGMMFINRHDDLRRLTLQNMASNGLASNLAEARQQTTKGLWAQFTSQFSEQFTQAFEALEPQIRVMLNNLMDKISGLEFAEGLKSIGAAMTQLFELVVKIGAWVGRNWTWIEPLFVSGVVLKQGVKLLGFIGNLRLAFKGLSGTGSILSSIASGMGDVTKSVGIAKQGKVGTFLAEIIKNGAFPMGTLGGLTAFSGAALAATGAVTGLVTALGYVGLKAYQAKQARDAVIQETETKNKYVFPDLDALNRSLKEAYDLAIAAKGAKTSLVTSTANDQTGVFGNKTIQWIKSGGDFLKNFIHTGYGVSSLLNIFNPAFRPTALIWAGKVLMDQDDANSWWQNANKEAIKEKFKQDYTDLQSQVWASISPMKTKEGILGVLNRIDSFRPTHEVDDTYYTRTEDGKRLFSKNLSNVKGDDLRKTYEYAEEWDSSFKPNVSTLVRSVANTMESRETAFNWIKEFIPGIEETLKKYGFSLNKNGKWEQQKLPANASQETIDKFRDNFNSVNNMLSTLLGKSALMFEGNAMIPANILEKAGFGRELYELNPQQNDIATNGVSYGGGGGNNNNGRDDESAGGNYSGTGKLYSVTPKQVIVTINNLLSVQTISLMNKNEDGHPELTDLKNQIAQTLIDAVKDYEVTYGQ